MTVLLEKAIKKLAKLSQNMQDEIAQQLLEDIEGELRWDETFKKSQKQLAKLAEEALKEFKAGKTKKMGFDEL